MQKKSSHIELKVKILFENHQEVTTCNANETISFMFLTKTELEFLMCHLQYSKHILVPIKFHTPNFTLSTQIHNKMQTNLT